MDPLHHPAARRRLVAPSDLKEADRRDICGALNALLADVFALHFKTKNFHWHVSGPHFRAYHLLLDEQADQIFALIDPLAERVRKLGGLTLHSMEEACGKTRIKPNEAAYVEPADMIAELSEDNLSVLRSLRAALTLCAEAGDGATASLLEVWLDEAERRVWFLFESSRAGQTGGH